MDFYIQCTLTSPLLALLFWCADWPRFDQCRPFPPASYVLLIRFCLPWGTSLLSDTAKCSGLTCTFLAPALKSVFSKEPLFLSVENGIFIVFLTYSLKYIKSTSTRIWPKPWLFHDSTSFFSVGLPMCLISVVAVKAPRHEYHPHTPHPGTHIEFINRYFLNSSWICTLLLLISIITLPIVQM